MDQDFQLGLWVVRPTLNSVSRNGDNIRLEPKAMEVLACLAHADGKVVSKDKLIAEVWADTPFVGDDVLVRCPRIPNTAPSVPKIKAARATEILFQ